MAEARARLHTALARCGVELQWTEWDTTREATPVAYHGYASPTVLVNGVDVARKPAVSGGSCAVGGGPSVEQLAGALRGR